MEGNIEALWEDCGRHYGRHCGALSRVLRGAMVGTKEALWRDC